MTDCFVVKACCLFVIIIFFIIATICMVNKYSYRLQPIIIQAKTKVVFFTCLLLVTFQLTPVYHYTIILQGLDQQLARGLELLRNIGIN